MEVEERKEKGKGVMGQARVEKGMNAMCAASPDTDLGTVRKERVQHRREDKRVRGKAKMIRGLGGFEVTAMSAENGDIRKSIVDGGRG